MFKEKQFNMAVSDYNIGCKYINNRLKNCIYLVSENHLKEITIDNDSAYISGLTETPYEIDGYNIQFTENESLNGRYRFSKTITLSVNGYFTLDDLNDRYYAIIETIDDVKYMVNVDFPSNITYTYNLSKDANETDITFSTESNFPSLQLLTEFDHNPICKVYTIGGIEKLQLIEKNYASIDTANEEIVTTVDPKVIEFNSAEFKEEYDGKNVTDTITFNLNLDDYKSSWHWNMLEFTDNKYVAIINCKDHNNVFYVGFNFGLNPSYSIQSTSSNNNGITITLEETSIYGSTVTTELDILKKTYRGWNNIKAYNDIKCYECTDAFGVAQYLVKQEVDYFGNPTNNYMVLDGYESQFSFLPNIVDTFDEADTFQTYECISDDDCYVETNIPSLIEYSAVTCYTFSLSAVCPFHFDDIPNNITVTPSSGDSGSHTIQICQTDTPTATLVEGNMTLNYGSHSDIITLKTQLPVADVRPTTAYINCLQQEVSFIFNNYCRIYVTHNPSNLTYTITSNALVVLVPKNDSTSYSNFTLAVTDCNGVDTQLLIRQGQVYQNWVEEDGYICISGDSYHIERLYTGSTYGNWTATDETRVGELIQSGSTSCSDAMTKWEFDGNYLCEDGNKLEALEEMESYDNGSTWTKTGRVTLGDFVESGSSFCEQSTTYDWNLSDQYICSGTTSYYLYQQYIKIGSQNYIPNYPLTYSIDGEGTETPDEKSENDVECGYVEPLNPIYRWQKIDGDYICDECTKLRLTYNDSTTYDINCISSTSSTLTNEEVSGGTKPISTIDFAYIGGCCTSIGNGAFSDCINMTSVDIPNSVTTIGNLAFADCSGMTEINLPNSVTSIGLSAFRRCVNAKSLKLSNTMPSIGGGAFYYCTGLESISIPNSVRTIGVSSFAGCSSAKSLFLGYGVQTISGNAFYQCSGLTSIDIPYSVTSIGDNAFGYCSAASALTIGSGLETIGEYAFNQCRALKSLYIPNTLKHIDNGAFTYCQGLKSIVIGNGIESIGELAFESCDNLDEISIYATTPPSIESNTFDDTNDCPIYVPAASLNDYLEAENWSNYANRIYPMGSKITLTYSDSTTYNVGCDQFGYITQGDITGGTQSKENIISVELGECASVIEIGAFKGCSAMTTMPNLSAITSVRTSAFSGCSSLTSIDIPNSVTNVGSSAFTNCSSASALTIGSGITVIDERTFLGCSGLTEINIPNNIATIGNYAFSGCSSATALTIGSGISIIGGRAFKDCSGLTAITINTTEVPTLGDNPFENTNNCPIYVPSSAVNDYKSAPYEWERYRDRITAITE